jgi:phosphate butyryltransferase
MIRNFEELLSTALKIKGKRVVVVFPNNEETFHAINDSYEKGLANFTIVGDENIVAQHLKKYDTSRVQIIQEPTVTGALKTAIALLRDGRGDILLKGGVDTSTMMKAVLAEEAGIRTGRLLSDVFMFEYPSRTENKFIMITDGGLTLAPDLKNKIDLINNAVEVAHALGNLKPKVAVLSAMEFIVPTLQSTLDAAALAKMNERGQIKGCIVDGPFALDNAILPEAAAEKGIKSPVAGNAEILIAPSIEAANSLAKSTTIFAGMRLAHVIIGAKIPILIPSRADKADAKLLSVALGVIMSEHYSK